MLTDSWNTADKQVWHVTVKVHQLRPLLYSCPKYCLLWRKWNGKRGWNKSPKADRAKWRKCSLKLFLHFLPRTLSYLALTSVSAPEADRDGGILGTERFIWKYQAPKLARSVYLNLLEEQLCDFRHISKNDSRQFIAFLPWCEDPKYIISHQKDIMFDWL